MHKLLHTDVFEIIRTLGKSNFAGTYDSTLNKMKHFQLKRQETTLVEGHEQEPQNTRVPRF